jgi:sterol desaturase/sphingolipid hydroxylase (fatty acid hydroxylase superfamily)
MFTHVHWSVPVIIFAPVVAYFLYVASTTWGMHTSTIVTLFFSGLFVWTFTEYTLHRYVFHFEPKSEWGKRMAFMMHGVHHDYPNDTKRLVMVPTVSIPLASLFYVIFWLALGTDYVAPFFAGFMFGYICYDEIHYATHHAPLKGGVFQWLKHHHVLHHYKDPEKGYGVSSPIWDVVFGTLEEGEKEQEKATA